MNAPKSEPGSVEYDVIVAGGGAAGFFAAITCAEARPGARVVILEKGREVLGKVKISGGGRCNVTHGCFDPRELVEFYPRGGRQLIGPLHRWGPADTTAWFEDRGVALKIEEDGRVFPVSDDSQTIIDCLVEAAKAAGVVIQTGCGVSAVTGCPEGGFEVGLGGSEVLRGRQVLLTLGGTRNQVGADIAAGFGHGIEEAAPSLFTFKIDDPRIAGLQGLSVADVRVEAAGLSAGGPVLVTHWGLSGPAVLKLSAWGARELLERNYRFEVEINWCGTLSEGEIMEEFDRLRAESPKRKVANDPRFGIPARLWKRLVAAAAGGEENALELRWPHLERDVSRKLARELGAGRFSVDGKSMNKDEFVTCGGVSLEGIDFKTMESRLAEGLYFAGEILDIDGLTGGFNFQSAWTTGRIAGEAMAASK